MSNEYRCISAQNARARADAAPDMERSAKSRMDRSAAPSAASPPHSAASAAKPSVLARASAMSDDVPQEHGTPSAPPLATAAHEAPRSR